MDRSDIARRIRNAIAAQGTLGRTLRRAKSLAATTDPIYRRVLAPLIESRVPATESNSAGWHVLIAPPGGGNIGDDAMVESAIQNLGGRVCVVSSGGERGSDIDGVEQIHLPHLIYGNARGFTRDYRRFLALLADAQDVSIVGADVMDGAYNYRSSCSRALVAERTARRGIPTRVLGFSWNSAPNAAALRAVRRAGVAGVKLLVRDPHSFERIVSDGVRNCEAVADTVFALDTGNGEAPVNRRQKVKELLGVGGRYAVLNVSGLIQSRFDQTEDFVAVIAELHRLGIEVVLLPHVQRPHDDDVAAARRVMDRVSRLPHGSGVHLVDRLYTPAEVSDLAEGAEFVVTGRMHLAILALSRGVPVAILATQGKVSGLASLFGLDWVCIPPRAGMSVEILGAVRRFEENREQIVAQIAERLDHVRLLARQNFREIDREAMVV